MKYTLLDETWSDDSTLAVFVCKAEWRHGIYNTAEVANFVFVVDDIGGGKFIGPDGSVRHVSDEDDLEFIEWLDLASDGPQQAFPDGTVR
jgi:hypothetical protein